MPLRKISM